MVLELLILIPVIAGLAAIGIRSDATRRVLLVGTAAVHAMMVVAIWFIPPRSLLPNWVALDDLALIMISITSGLFLMVSIYLVGYLARERPLVHHDFEEGVYFANQPEARFTVNVLFFLATMCLVPLSRHFGLLWVGLEASTLASAPLIYFHRQHRSLEATWKYLLLCSVGIALALIGTFALAAAAVLPAKAGAIPLFIDELTKHASQLDPTWLKAAFLFLLVGYGTKAGLAPLHNWLPDAHSEAPSAVSALLSGAVLNCAMVGIIRSHQVLAAAGQEAFSGGLLVVFGLISMGVAAVFIFGQSDYKRMLAYSSVEHMGIVALGIGLGGVGVVGAMLHAMNHSFAKGLLFLTAGNILSTFHTRSTTEVRGILRVLPSTGMLWLIGGVAILGMPPFGLFNSELTVLRAAVDAGRYWVAGLYLAFLAIIFIGMITIILNMAQGSPPPGLKRGENLRETSTMIIPPALLAVLTFGLGLYVPTQLGEMLRSIARLLGAQS